MKHVYRGVILFVVFILSTIFMQRYMKDVTISFGNTVSMKEATFPLLYVQYKDKIMNEMHGYSSSLNAVNVRESMTYLDSTKKIKLCLDDTQKEIRKINYETRLVSSNELIERDGTTGIKKNSKGKYVIISLKESYLQGKEYAMKLIAITAEGRKINYYTRLKFYADESYFNEKFDFIQKFHNATFHKNDMEQYASYLEYGASNDSTLAYVDIKSSVNNVAWGDLKPKVVSSAIPVFTEYTRETASVVYQYYVKANTGRDIDDLYYVNEYIRIRYANNRMYLLGYQRRMEEIYNSDLTDVKQNALKTGVTNDENLEMHSTKDQTKLAFVRPGALWYYDTVENRAVKVFSFLTKKKDYERSGYNHYGINVINMDDEGNIDFVVYGYINRGDYEGRVAVILYKFHASENRIQELVYIPMETTYEMLKEDLNDYGYLSANGVFYFAMNHEVYSYNIASKKIKTIANDITEDNMILLENAGYLAWQDSNNAKKNKKIHILNMESEQLKVLTAKSNENIAILGSSDGNIIFGRAKATSIWTSKQGKRVIPYYEVSICNGDGKVLKKYSKSGLYVESIVVNNNVITLNRIKKSQETALGYESVRSDSIINRQETDTPGFVITQQQSKKAMKEYYIKLPANVVLQSVPKQKTTMNTIVTSSTTLVLEQKSSNVGKYYVFGYGTIIGAYHNVGEAIREADQAMGAVMDSQFRIVWERGGKFLSNTIQDYKKITTTSSIDSVGACIAMALEFNGVSCSAEKISEMRESIDEILKSKSHGNAYNLTGCNLDEALYYVSAGFPVIAMKSTSQAVLLVGYDEYYVKYYDPAANVVQTILLTNADSIFKENGYIFNVCMN